MLAFISIVYSVTFLLGIAGIYLFNGGVAGVVKSFSAGAESFKYLGIGAVTGIAVVLMTGVLTDKLAVFKRLEEEFQRILGRLKVYEVVIIALVSGIAEETVFRGAVQPHLGLILTSILFGVMHFPVKRTLIPWTVFAGLMGFLLGGLYIYTGYNLLAPITAHCLINMINLYRISRDNDKSDVLTTPHYSYLGC